MKNIILSFDDGRWDTFERALPIIEKYGLTCTINIISDFVLNPQNYHLSCCKKGSMSKEQVLYAQKIGMEIAAHGQKHNNDVEGIIAGIEEMKGMGVDVSEIGFASPESVLTEKNYDQVNRLRKDGVIRYIRTGVQLKREGYLYAGLTVINRRLHSKLLFYLLNKRWIINDTQKKNLLPSVSITSDIEPSQLYYLIHRVADQQTIILMFHSILNKEDPGYGEGIWYWDYEKFEQLCDYLHTSSKINVMTTKSFVEAYN